MSSTDRSQILRMVENGEVSVEEAIGMMSPTEEQPSSSDASGVNRLLRVRVSDLKTGIDRVRVKIPLGLMRWGFALGSRFAPELHGLDWDAMIADLDQYAEGRIVDVEDSRENQRVEIYIE